MQSKIEVSLAVLLFPFRNLGFYEKDLFREIACKDKKSTYLRKEIIEYVWWKLGINHKPHSFDEVKLMLQKYYPFIFDEKKLSNNDVLIKYFDILNKLSKSLISHRDGKITYKYWKNENDKEIFGPYDALQKIEIFNSLSRMMPLDIIAINYLLENEMEDEEQLNGFYSNIILSDMQLEDILVSGVAENHVHAGAGFDFTIAWNIIMNQFLSKNKSYIKLFDKYSKYREYNVTNYMLSCGILRLILSIYLNEVHRDLEGYNKELKEWIIENYKDNNYSINEFIDMIFNGKDIDKWVEGKKILGDLENTYFEIFEGLWNKLIFKHNVDIEENSEDYIFDIFHKTKNIKTYGENIFIFYCLKYIKHKKNDTMFLELFLNYLRIKSNIFNSIVQSGNNIKGLDYFKKYYANASKSIRMVNDRLYWKTFFRKMFQDRFLKKLEVRISLNKNFKKNLIDILSAYKEVIDKDYNNGNVDFPMFGIVIHLLKTEDNKPIEKCWNLYKKENETSSSELYFGEIQEEYFNKVKQLIDLRNEVPYLSEFLLGLDAASGENDIPISVFAPVFEKARDSKSQSMLSKNKHGKVIKNKSLAFTFHAGEERFEKFEVNEAYNKSEIGENEKDCKKIEIFCKETDNRHTTIWNPDKLNHAYNCKCYLKNIYEPIQVAVTDIDCDMIFQIQKIIYSRVATKGIVVEVNPTSNTVIGEMDSLFNHHAYMINDILEPKKDKVILNINSDDPTVFNTNVSNEIAYLYYGLLYKKVSREDALAWIDKLRDYGIKTSFINSQINHRQYYQYLNEILEYLK